MDLLKQHGAPLRILWITCGNTSNARMRHILTTALPTALKAMQGGEALVEIGDTTQA